MKTAQEGSRLTTFYRMYSLLRLPNVSKPILSTGNEICSRFFFHCLLFVLRTPTALIQCAFQIPDASDDLNIVFQAVEKNFRGT